MPKMKTKRAAAKRFKITKSGKILRAKTGHSHLLSKKEMKRKRRLRKVDEVHESKIRSVKRLLGL
ncbi:MAG: 50S ribosomal protein L35 [Actinobacteria bacterium]|nr:50S ribosomal protein L35 [Actinomycetota bacterium]